MKLLIFFIRSQNVQNVEKNLHHKMYVRNTWKNVNIVINIHVQTAKGFLTVYLL